MNNEQILKIAKEHFDHKGNDIFVQHSNGSWVKVNGRVLDFATALLAIEQEPVAWMNANGEQFSEYEDEYFKFPLFTHPPQAECERYRKLVTGEGCPFAETDDAWYDINLMNEILDGYVANDKDE